MSILLVSSFSLISAQDLSQDEILANLEQRAESLETATFLLTGRLIDADGTEFPLEIDVQAILPEQVVRADFYQPDALADNFIMIDNDKLYNYIFLTNQATLLNSNDPDALGGVFGNAEGEAVNFTLDIQTIFSGWDLEVKGYESTADGNAYLLEFLNLDSDVIIHKVESLMLDEVWLPQRMQFFGESDTLLAELIFNNWQTNIDLDPEDVRYLPDDTEIIDER